MRVTFSVVDIEDKRSVGMVTYRVIGPSDTGSEGEVVLQLEGVSFLDGSGAVMEKTVLGHVPIQMRYRRGANVELLWPGWRRNGYQVKDITDCDVTFERFWNLYGKKVGNKAGVAKKWEKLSWEERVLAIGCIGRMRRYYEKKGLDLPYPETYINQRRWENEFE